MHEQDAWMWTSKVGEIGEARQREVVCLLGCEKSQNMMLFGNALIRVANAKTHNDCFTTNLIKATCWKQCGCVLPHQNSRMSHFSVIITICKLFFAGRLYVALLFYSSTLFDSIHRNPLDHSFNGFACVRVCASPFSWKLRNVQMKIEKITKFGVQFSNFHVFILQLCISCIVCLCRSLSCYVRMFACVCVCVRVLNTVWHYRYCSAHFCYRTWPLGQRYFKFCDIWKWTF